MKWKWLILLNLVLLCRPATAQQTTEVWPGDASANGTVSHIDLLYWGRWFGETGNPRDSISINWTAHEVIKWLPPLPGRPDPAHADCNGDSTVDFADLIAIEFNYGLDNQSNLADPTSLGQNSNQAAPLSVVLNGGPLISGSTDTLWIELGDSVNPVDSLLGFATTLTFDSTLVDTAYAIFNDSWLGSSRDLVTLDRYRPGELDLAATRTDRLDRLNGNGRVGGVVIVMIENLKTEIEVEDLKIGFRQVLALTSDLEAAPVFIAQDTLQVYRPTGDFEALVYPVPTTGQLNIRVLIPTDVPVEARLIDLQGRVARRYSFQQSISIPRNGLNSGIYLLELHTGEMVLRKRVIFLE